MATAVQEIDSEQAKAVPTKRSKLRMLVLAALALSLIGGAVASYVLLFSGKKTPEKAETAPKPPAFFDVPEITVNLSTAPGERPQYLKVKIVLELADAALVARVQAMMPRLMDAFQVFLRELRAADLDGSAGMQRLKEELTRRVNLAIAPARVNAVLFKEMLVQ